MKEQMKKILKLMFFVGLISTIFEIVVYSEWSEIVLVYVPIFGILGMIFLIMLILVTGIVFLITTLMYLIAYLINRKNEKKWKKVIGVILIAIATVINAITTFVYAAFESFVFTSSVFYGIICAIPAVIDVLCYIYIFVKLISRPKTVSNIESEIETQIESWRETNQYK